MKIGWIAFGMILIFVVVSPAVSATVPFEDDFNDDNLDGWKTGSNGEVGTSDAQPTHNDYYAKMTGESGKEVWIKREKIDTSGHKNIQLSCYIRTDFQLSTLTGDTKDEFMIYWRSPPGSFELLKTIKGASGWTYWKWDLPLEAGDKEDIRIKFELKNCEATDFACVDDVLVTDTPTGDPIPEFSTIAIPAVALLGLVFVLSRRKQKE